MKKFIIKASLFLSIIVFSGIVLEVWLRTLPNVYKKKAFLLSQQKEKIEVLILGSSHTYFGIDPVYFDKPGFNLAHVSQSLDIDYKLLKHYGSQMPKLKTVIIPVSYFTPWEQMVAGTEYWRIKYYVIYYGLAPFSSWLEYAEVLTNRLETHFKRIIAHYFRKEKTMMCNEKGWGTAYGQSLGKNLITSGAKAARRHTRKELWSDQNKEIYAENKACVKEIIQWCQARNIKLILLSTPAWSTYYSKLKAGQRDAMRFFAISLVANHAHCEYIDMTEHPNFEATDFYDADHLSAQGARKLTLLVNEKLTK